MPTSSSNLRAVQHDFAPLVLNNTWEEVISLALKEAASVSELANAAEVPQDLSGSTITLYVLNEIDESTVRTISTLTGEITINPASTDEFIIKYLVDIPVGNYKYYLDISSNGDNYTYMVGKMVVIKP